MASFVEEYLLNPIGSATRYIGSKIRAGAAYIGRKISSGIRWIGSKFRGRFGAPLSAALYQSELLPLPSTKYYKLDKPGYGGVAETEFEKDKAGNYTGRLTQASRTARSVQGKRAAGAKNRQQAAEGLVTTNVRTRSMRAGGVVQEPEEFAMVRFQNAWV